MFCSGCGSAQRDDAQFCTACGKPMDRVTAVAASSGAIPDGVKGWSWGAFLLNWIWAIGNRTWIGLLAMVPYVGIIVAFWLGFKGREMAWKNAKWDSVEHFNRVQRSWSRWAVGLTLVFVVIGILAAIAIPAYMGFAQHAREAADSQF